MCSRGTTVKSGSGSHCPRETWLKYPTDQTNVSDTTTLTHFGPALFPQCNYWPVPEKQPVDPDSESDLVEQSVLLSDPLSLSPVARVGSLPRVEKSISHCVIYHIFTLVEPRARSTAAWAHKQKKKSVFVLYVCVTQTDWGKETDSRNRGASLWLVFSVCPHINGTISLWSNAPEEIFS